MGAVSGWRWLQKASLFMWQWQVWEKQQEMEDSREATQQQQWGEGIYRQKCGDLRPRQWEVEKRAGSCVRWWQVEIVEMMDSGAGEEDEVLGQQRRQLGRGGTMWVVNLNFDISVLRWLLEDGDQPYRPSCNNHENRRYEWMFVEWVHVCIHHLHHGSVCVCVCRGVMTGVDLYE